MALSGMRLLGDLLSSPYRRKSRSGVKRVTTVAFGMLHLAAFKALPRNVTRSVGSADAA
jgi:hypothetical protein